ncbi:hypothetical protein CVT25_005065 [Psilocybe cyanescens]|uniref:C3H1-type domain-containing protein n=1 Tax=Psilocybe cyanescens TaxID=93625 RepID=A0A409XDX9_PSICY|nr:hypothetical protein CVT25_005065 [Psilocybe cyanescens]
MCVLLMITKQAYINLCQQDKVQSICRSNNDHGFCKFKAECRYDHDLVDGRRLEQLVCWADEGMSPSNDKVQSICRSNNDHGFCKFKAECRYDHDLVDGRRLEQLVCWADEGMSPNRDYMTVECRVESDQEPIWKITMKPDAFAKLRHKSNRHGGVYEGKDLLKFVRLIERAIGSKRYLFLESETLYSCGMQLTR